MSTPLPDLGSIVFQTDGGGMPLPSLGIWEVWATDARPDAEWPVELRRVDTGEWVETTQYRITPVLDHVVVDPSAVEEATRADERAKVLAELNKWVCCTHFHEDDLLAKLDEMREERK